MSSTDDRAAHLEARLQAMHEAGASSDEITDAIMAETARLRAEIAQIAVRQAARARSVEETAAELLSQTAQVWLAVQSRVQPDSATDIGHLLRRSAEIRVEVGLHRGGGGVTLRMLAVDGQGTDLAVLRSLDLAGRPAQ